MQQNVEPEKEAKKKEGLHDSQEQDQAGQNPPEEEASEDKKHGLLWIVIAAVAVFLILIAVLVAFSMSGREDLMEGKILNQQEMIDDASEALPPLEESDFEQPVFEEPVLEEEPADVPKEPEEEPAAVQDSSECELDGKNYPHGEARVSKSGCEDCVCDNGSWSCQDNGACAAQPNPQPNVQPSGQPGDCDFQGATYRDGETRKADCDHICTCNKGNWDCVMQPSSTCCRHNGQLRKSGETFPAGDGCNQCTCYNGGVNCTAMACGP